MQLWKRAKEDTVTDFGWRKIVEKHFTLPNGSEGRFVTDTWGHDNAAVVALTKENKVVVAKQFRTGPEKILYELPGGLCDGGESPEVSALREFKEETGYTSDSELVYLGKVCRNGYHNDDAYYYLLRGCYQTSNQELDDNEFIEVTEVGYDEMEQFAKEGLVSDATALFMAKDYIQKEKNT